MKKIYFISIFGITAVIIAFLSFKYNDEPLDTLLNRLYKFDNEFPQEKVHLHIDKPFYSLGEDIWFKAYVVDAKENHLSDRSRILYIDLLDARDSVKQTLLLPIVNGTTSGNIRLADSILSAGTYHIYAYTKWMQNFGSEFFFKKDVPIVNALKGAVNGNMVSKTLLTENGTQVNTDLAFNNNDGTSFGYQPVSYTITANGKILSSGKATTDINGKISLSQPLKEYKDIPVTINTSVIAANHQTFTQDFVIRPLSSVANVQFFPEGGHMVNGIRTKVAFKVLKPDGLGEDVTGYVTDETNERLAEFKSEHAGMGVFALAPVIGKTYTAVIKHENGLEKKYRLPEAETSGYVLNVNLIGNDSLSVKISASANLLNGKEAVLIAQCNGVVKFVARPKLDQVSNLSYIPAKKFPNGIVQFTLFTPDGVPVAERLVFVQHNNQLNANIKTDKAAYAIRGKVNIDLKVTDFAGQAATGSFSIAVTDDTKVKTDENNETSVLSNLLLTSDIKGYVEQPNYYFNVNNPQREKYLDALLLTQGWRRFNWTDLQANKFPIIKYQPEKSLAVTGSVTTIGNKPLGKGKVTLFAKTAAGPLIADTTTDENGHFVFDNLDFADSAKLIIRATNNKNSSTVKTIIDRKARVPYDVMYASVGDAGSAYLIGYAKFAQERFEELTKFGLLNNATALKEVKIVSKKDYFAKTTVPHSANISPGSADYVIKPEKLATEPNLLYVFYAIPGIEVKNNMVYAVPRGISLTSNKPMTVIVDGAIVTPSDLKDIPPGDVEGIEILTSGSNRAMYGSDGTPGVLIITIKRASDITSIDNSFNKAHYTPQGYTQVKQFYSPAYDTPNQTKMTDLRSTIYWNPDVITDAQGHASISYFNADGTGTYKVTIEGMDTRGGLLRKTFTYVVK